MKGKYGIFIVNAIIMVLQIMQCLPNSINGRADMYNFTLIVSHECVLMNCSVFKRGQLFWLGSQVMAFN
jgi:hypothetical protein